MFFGKGLFSLPCHERTVQQIPPDRQTEPTLSALCYLQLLLLEHVRLWSIEDVISKLSLTVYVDWRRGFTGQEAVVNLPGTLRQLGKRGDETER